MMRQAAPSGINSLLLLVTDFKLGIRSSYTRQLFDKSLRAKMVHLGGVGCEAARLRGCACDACINCR